VTLHVSRHAVERYQERVADVTDDEAIAALSTPAIKAAAAFGAQFVRLGNGLRITINDGVVVTVLPASHHKKQVNRVGVRKFGRAGQHGRRED
jgi:hypothetical protein